MPTYIPAESQSEITCVAYCRQNCFKNIEDKDRDVLEIVNISNSIAHGPIQSNQLMIIWQVHLVFVKTILDTPIHHL